MSLYDQGSAAANALREALTNFDSSVDSLVEISALTKGRYDLEIRMLSEIDGMINGMNSQLDASIEKIQEDQRTDEENAKYFYDAAVALFSDLKGMTDPAMIAEAVAEIDRLLNKSYGYLGEEDQADQAFQYIGFLERVQLLGEGLLEEARQAVIDEGIALREMVGDVMQNIEDPLLLVASGLGMSADDLSMAAAELTSAANAVSLVNPVGSGGARLDPTGDGSTGNTAAVNVAVEMDSTGVEGAIRVGISSIGSDISRSMSSLSRAVMALADAAAAAASRGGGEVGGTIQPVKGGSVLM